MRKGKWIWMPHTGHFICGSRCRFHLNTYIGKYIVSTIGELWPERGVREIHAKVFDSKWFIQNKDLRYVLPLTPLFAFYIAYFLTQGSKWSRAVKISVVGIYYVFYFAIFVSFCLISSG